MYCALVDGLTKILNLFGNLINTVYSINFWPLIVNLTQKKTNNYIKVFKTIDSIEESHKQIATPCLFSPNEAINWFNHS